MVAAFAYAAAASAENVVFKIKAMNPAGSKQTVKVNKRLPGGLDPTTDVIDPGGMQLKYDAKSGVYYVEAETDLEPGQTRDYTVVLKDIWTIPEDKLAELTEHTTKLSAELAKTKRGNTAIELKKRIDATLAELSDRRQKYDFSVVRAIEHVQAYERSRELLNQVRADTTMLENMCVGEGIDPLKLRGLPPPLPEKTHGKTVIADKPLTMRIQVRNPASTRQAVPVKVYLPPEVLPEDINPGESLLEVRRDAERGMCYVTRDAVMVDAGQTVDFRILVTNKWVLDPERMVNLETRATNLQARTAHAFEGFKTEAEDIVKRLTEVEARHAPAELNDNYIAFYRQQAGAVDDIERSILRLEDLLHPAKAQDIFRAKALEKVQPPSRSNTWIIIYIILGFLAVVSTLFFLRWYGKSVDEKMADRGR